MKQISAEHINSTLELVGLQNCAKKKVSKFSLGMKQRLGIATAIMEQRIGITSIDDKNDSLEDIYLKMMS
jgi:ABC-2 type transport system ATP-binding protein